MGRLFYLPQALGKKVTDGQYFFTKYNYKHKKQTCCIPLILIPPTQYLTSYTLRRKTMEISCVIRPLSILCTWRVAHKSSHIASAGVSSLKRNSQPLATSLLSSHSQWLRPFLACIETRYGEVVPSRSNFNLLETDFQGFGRSLSVVNVQKSHQMF